MAYLRNTYHIGIIGTGFIARGLMQAIKYHPRLEVSSVLTRRNFESISDFPLDKKLLTHSVDQLIRDCDLVVVLRRRRNILRKFK